MRRRVHFRQECQPYSGPVSPCAVCNGLSFELISRIDRNKEPLDTGICRRCGLVSHLPIPSEYELREYYARRYREEYQRQQTPSHRHLMRAWRRAERTHRRLAPYLSSDDLVLDVGAGIGCLVKYWEWQGFRSEGIEPGHGHQLFAVNELRANVSRASLFDLPRQARYHAISLSHVIEHLRSPGDALQQLRGLLRDGGFLYVECPNLGAPFARFDRLFHFAHVHNFTAENLLALAAHCGLHLEKSFAKYDRPNLKLLFRKGPAVPLEIDSRSYAHTKQALAKASWRSYHLRPSYLLDRVRKLTLYSEELLLARRHTRSLLTRCRQMPAVIHAKVAKSPATWAGNARITSLAHENPRISPNSDWPE